jgi:hypothetical protein
MFLGQIYRIMEQKTSILALQALQKDNICKIITIFAPGIS